LKRGEGNPWNGNKLFERRGPTVVSKDKSISSRETRRNGNVGGKSKCRM